MAVDWKRLRTERVYETRAPLEQLAADLAEIDKIAAKWRGIRKRLLLAGAIAIALGCAVVASSLPAGLALIALGIILIIGMRRFPSSVTHDGGPHGGGRSVFAKSLAAMLACDTEPQTPAAVRVAFKPNRELLSESALPHGRSGKERLYRLSWFSLEATMCDGTTFTETVDDLVRQRSFRNPRGKYKTKTRMRYLIGMRFAYPQKTYGDLTPLAERMRKEMQTPSTALVRGLEVTGRIVKLKALARESGDLAQASSMLALGVYRMLNLSRETEGRKRSQPKGGAA